MPLEFYERYLTMAAYTSEAPSPLLLACNSLRVRAHNGELWVSSCSTLYDRFPLIDM